MKELDINWVSWSAQDIKQEAEASLKELKEGLAMVDSISKEERTFENTLAGIERADYAVADFLQRLEVLHNAHPSKEIRDAAQEISDKLHHEFVDVVYSDSVWRAIEEYSSKKEDLAGVEKKLLEDTRKNFESMGFGKSPEVRQAIKDNVKKRTELESQFSKNINEHQDYISVTREELDGLDEAYIQGLTKNEDGTFRVGLSYPEYFPFVRNARNDLKRKELADKYNTRGGEKNLDILMEILAIRKKLADLLEFKNYVGLSAFTLMSKTEDRIKEFVYDLAEKLKPGTAKDLEQLRDMKRELSGDPDAELKYYDPTFYIERLQEKKFNFDSEKLREYFPLEKVEDGIFEIYSRILGVKFERMSGVSLWHEDARLFRMLDLDGSVAAYFALDIFPREGKYGHAAAFPISGPREVDGEKHIPFAALMMNFRKAAGGRPSLLSHDEVETFFHEFGHLMHYCLARPKYLAHSAFGVAQDFVEAPSQMLEYWVWSEESLKMLSGHFETGEPIPQDMLSSLIASKSFMQAYLSMRQIMYALYDYLLHVEMPENNQKISDIYTVITKEYTGIDVNPKHMFAAGFGHLMGYAGRYYSYTWSRVFAADMFSRFKKEGVLNPGIGMDYRRFVLEPGSSIEELDLVRNFLGREPSNSEFLKEIGV